MLTLTKPDKTDKTDKYVTLNFELYSDLPEAERRERLIAHYEADIHELDPERRASAAKMFAELALARPCFRENIAAHVNALSRELRAGGERKQAALDYCRRQTQAELDGTEAPPFPFEVLPTWLEPDALFSTAANKEDRCGTTL